MSFSNRSLQSLEVYEEEVPERLSESEVGVTLETASSSQTRADVHTKSQRL